MVYLDFADDLCYQTVMATVQPSAHTHQGRILRWADGDTVIVLVRGTFGCWAETYLRLEGIESWELTGPHREKAVLARNALNEQTGGRDCLIHLRSHKHDRFGRLVGSITVGEQDMAKWIVEHGLAWHCTKEASIAAHRDGVQHQPQQEVAT